MEIVIVKFLIVLIFSISLSDCCNRCFTDKNGRSSSNRTVVFVNKETNFGQDLFIRGGISDGHISGCTTNVATDACAIGMRTRLLGTITHYDSYNDWRVNDLHLDWHGAEPGQGTYNGVAASGTPLVWTTNNVLSEAYQELNTYGDHYWMVDMEMDCAESYQGWFELKAFLSNDATGWESDISGGGTCSGTAGGTAPYVSTNHFARCGYVNVFTFGVGSCEIKNFTD